MPSSLSSSSSRAGALVCLAGVALILLGFFLPLFTASNPQVPGGTHPVYEWQDIGYGFSLEFWLLGVFAALPVLGILIILTTSLAALFRVPFPQLVRLKRAAAGGGLALQLFLEIIVYVTSSIGYDSIEIASGFVVIPLGFLITMMGVFIVEAASDEGRDSQRKRAIASLLGTVLVPLDVFAFAFLQLFSPLGPSRIEVSWGFVVVLLGFLVIAIGSFVVEPSSSENTLRKGALVNLVGVALTLPGFFLPMFTLHRVLVYEWQANQTSGDATNGSLIVVFGILAALPLLGMLIIFVTSMATLFRVPLPQLTRLKRAAAAWGLAAQLLFDLFVLLVVGDVFFGPMFLSLGLLCLAVAGYSVIATSHN
jgi:hypothetical protein